MTRIGRNPHLQLQQQIDKATANQTLSKKEVKGLIETAKRDGVDARELQMLDDLFQRAAPSVPGMVRPSGATQSEPPLRMAKSTAQTFINFLASAHADQAIPDMPQPINPNLGGTGQIPDDVIPDMPQPINPNLAGAGQIPEDVIPDMPQPINPNLGGAGQIPGDVIPDMPQPINPNLGGAGQIPGDVIPDMPQMTQLRIADPGQLDDHLTNNGFFGQLADLPGFEMMGVSPPEGERQFSQAVVSFTDTPSQSTFAKLDDIMQGVPFELSLTSDALDAVLTDKSDGPSLRQQLLDIEGITDIAYQTNGLGHAKPIIFQRGRLSESAQAQVSELMSQAHLDYELDNTLAFFGR